MEGEAGMTRASSRVTQEAHHVEVEREREEHDDLVDLRQVDVLDRVPRLASFEERKCGEESGRI